MAADQIKGAGGQFSGRTSEDLLQLHEKREQFLFRIDDLKKALELYEYEYYLQRPKLIRSETDEYNDPRQLLPIIKWLDTGDVEYLEKAFPTVKPITNLPY